MSVTTPPITNVAAWDAFLQQNRDKVILLWFTSPGCGPCRQMASGMRVIRERYADQVVFAEIKVENVDYVSIWGRIEQLPTFRLYVREVLVDEWFGSKTEKVENMIKRYVQS